MRDFSIAEDLFSTSEMRSIWSEFATVSAWLEVEKVLACVQAEVGLIPPEAANAIANVLPNTLDLDQLRLDMALAGRPIVGLVNQIREHLGPEVARYVHHNATTQDIMDTALAMQMKLGLDVAQGLIDRCLTHLNRLIQDHGEAEMMGRTNGQLAVPMQFSTKLGVWKAEMVRRSSALNDAASRGLNVQVGGPVGDLGKYDQLEQGLAVKDGVASKLRLASVEPHWQNARDGVVEIGMALGQLCATISKISHNINLLASDEICELSEAYEPGKGASSSMAHKHNQRGSEFGEAVARLGRQRSEQLGEVAQHQHERSGGAWIGEWVIVPEVFLLTSGALHWLATTLELLTVNQDAMQAKVQACRAPS